MPPRECYVSDGCALRHVWRLVMPHVHSAEARALQRLRALRFDFVVSHSADKAHVEVPRTIAKDVKLMSASLARHRECEQMAGQKFHYARHASMAITSGLSLAADLALHRCANRAKHRGSAGDSLANDTKNDESDPLFVSDPWAGASMPLLVTPGLAFGQYAAALRMRRLRAMLVHDAPRGRH